PQYAIAMSGSSVAACRNERSDSRNQNECTWDTPWLKKRRASSELVVTGMSVLPWPCISRAGNSGCAPGGTAHRSASGRGACAAAMLAASERQRAPVRRTAVWRMAMSLAPAGTPGTTQKRALLAARLLGLGRGLCFRLRLRGRRRGHLRHPPCHLVRREI